MSENGELEKCPIHGTELVFVYDDCSKYPVRRVCMDCKDTGTTDGQNLRTKGQTLADINREKSTATDVGTTSEIHQQNSDERTATGY